MARQARVGTTSFILRDIDDKLWKRVKRQLARDAKGATERLALRDAVLSALEAYAQGGIPVRRHD